MRKIFHFTAKYTFCNIFLIWMSNNAGGDTSPVEPAINSETIIKDTGKHTHNIHEENTNSTNTFTSTTHHVTKQESEEIEKIRNFLYREYEGHCQICGDTFAYKGKNYFKLKSLNTGKSRDVSRKGNTLCLCPKHWEIFDKKLINFKFLENIKDTNPLSIDTIDKQFKTYGLVGKDDIDEDNDAFYMLDERDDFIRDDVYFLPIQMFDKIYYLKFTKAHMMEFVEVWNNN